MPRSTSPTRHRRVPPDGYSNRVKVAATAIAVATLLMAIAVAVDSHRLVTAWHGDVRANLDAPVGGGPPGHANRARPRIVTSIPHVAPPGRVHGGPIQHSTPAQSSSGPTGSPTGSPTDTPTGSYDWTEPMSPA